MRSQYLPGAGLCISWKKHFPKEKKVKSLVYFPTILNCRIIGEMDIYSIMSTIINIFFRKHYFLPEKTIFRIYFTYLCVCQTIPEQLPVLKENCV